MRATSQAGPPQANSQPFPCMFSCPHKVTGVEGSRLALASVAFASVAGTDHEVLTLAGPDYHRCHQHWDIRAPAYCPLPRQTGLASQPATSPSSSRYQKVCGSRFPTLPLWLGWGLGLQLVSSGSQFSNSNSSF